MALKKSSAKESITIKQNKKDTTDFSKEIYNRFKDYETGKVNVISLDTLEEKARKSYSIKINT